MPVTRHHAETCPGVPIELERQTGRERGEVEHDRKVHEHDVVLRDVEVVHHHHVGDVDALELLHDAIGADADVVQVRRLRAEVAECDQLTRDRAHLGVRRHRRGERSPEVLVPDRVEFGVDLPGPVGLLEAEQLLVARDHVRVAGAPSEVAHVGHRGRHPPVPVTLGVCTKRLRYHSAFPRRGAHHAPCRRRRTSARTGRTPDSDRYAHTCPRARYGMTPSTRSSTSVRSSRTGAQLLRRCQGSSVRVVSSTVM